MIPIIAVSVAMVVLVNAIARRIMNVEQQCKPLDTYFSIFCGCMLWAFVMYFLGFMILFLGVADGNIDAAIGCSMIGLVPSFILLTVGTVYNFMLMYQLWKLIPAEIARTTPGKAIGFCFIPFFNFYWFFVAYLGLAEDMNKTLRRHGIQYHVKEHLGMTLSILWIFTYFFFPVLIIVWLVINIYFFKSVLGGAIALIEGQEQGMVMTENTTANTDAPRQSATVPPANSMTIEIIIDGTTQTVTKQELFRLVTSGKISADTPVIANGKLITVETAMTMDSTETVGTSKPTPQPATVHNDNKPSNKTTGWEIVSNIVCIFIGLWFFTFGTGIFLLCGCIMFLIGMLMLTVNLAKISANE